MKPFNFFWASFLGMLPQIFLICSIGNGVEKMIDQNLEAPSFLELIFYPDIYIPIIIFIFLFIVTIILKKKFYKK